MNCVCVCVCVSQASGHGSLVSGAFCPPLDKPEQGLDLIRDAARNAGFELNQGMGVIVDVGADKLFDEVTILISYFMLVITQWHLQGVDVCVDVLMCFTGEGQV